jgi:DNA-nicking Smr family endonuclease
VRQLSPDEAALWARVAATIKPLSRNKNHPQAVDEQHIKPSHVVGHRAASSPPGPRKPAPIGISLDGSWDRRLREGRVDPDRRIDLHGMSLDSAWQAIDRGLERAIAAGERVVLLITGHHRAGEPPVLRGKIRAAVHDWLAASRHAGEIAAVRGAHQRHGGGGSLYIILRRR